MNTAMQNPLPDTRRSGTGNTQSNICGRNSGTRLARRRTPILTHEKRKKRASAQPEALRARTAPRQWRAQLHHWVGATYPATLERFLDTLPFKGQGFRLWIIRPLALFLLRLRRYIAGQLLVAATAQIDLLLWYGHVFVLTSLKVGSTQVGPPSLLHIQILVDSLFRHAPADQVEKAVSFQTQLQTTLPAQRPAGFFLISEPGVGAHIIDGVVARQVIRACCLTLPDPFYDGKSFIFASHLNKCLYFQHAIIRYPDQHRVFGEHHERSVRDTTIAIRMLQLFHGHKVPISTGGACPGITLVNQIFVVHKRFAFH